MVGGFTDVEVRTLPQPASLDEYDMVRHRSRIAMVLLQSGHIVQRQLPDMHLP